MTGNTTTTGSGWDFTPLSGGACHNQTGALWSTSTVDFTQPFDIYFQASFDGGGTGADGICAVFGNFSNTTSPVGAGGGLGYYGGYTVFSNNTFAIEYDTYDNGTPADDITADHTTITLNSNIGSAIEPHADPVQLDPTSTYIKDGTMRNYKITWSPATQTMLVYCNCSLRIISYYNYKGIFPSPTAVTWGFTGSTGGYCSHQIIQNISMDHPGSTTNITQCGAPVVLTAPSGSLFYWSTGATSSTISVSTSGTYSVISYNSTSCASSQETFNVTINPIPTIHGSSTVCVGSYSPPFTGTTGSGTWISSNTTVATVGYTSGVVYGANVGTSIISFTSGAGCVGTKVVTVVPTPSFTPTSNSPICAGHALDLFWNTSGSCSSCFYSWSGPDFFSSASADPIRTPAITAMSGIYWLSVTNSFGCQKTNSVSVTVNPSPVLAPTVTGSPNLCIGSTLNFNSGAGSCPGCTYHWSGPGPWNSTLVTPTRGPATTAMGGVYTVSVTNTYGCTTTGTVSVTVYPYPTFSVSATTPCSGGTLNLTGTIGVCSGCNYTWTGPGPWSSGTSYFTSDASRTPANIGMDGTYTLTVTNAGGCSTTHTVSATVIPSPTVTVTSNPNPPSICPGYCATLTATYTGTLIPVSYTWTPGGGSCSTCATDIVCPSATTTYSVHVTTGGCSGTATKTVTVNPTPVISGTYTVCVGASHTLTSSVGGGTWTSGNTAVGSIVSSSGTYTGVSAGTTVITYTSPAGCLGFKTVTVDPIPVFTPTYSPNPLCSGETLDLWWTSPAGTPGISGWGYVWTGPSSFGSGIANPTIGSTTLSNTGTYSLTVTNNFGCKSEGTVSVTVNPTPVITGSLSVCAGLTTTLTPTPSGGSWTYTSTSTTETIVGGNLIITGVTAGTDLITYVTTAGCYAYATVTVNPVPSPVIKSGLYPLCVGQSESISGLPGISGTYTTLWTCTPAIVSFVPPTGLGTIMYGVTAGTGIITFSVTSSAGCTGTATVTMTVNTTPTAIVGSPNVCLGATETLTDPVAGGTWSSSDPGVGSIDPLSGLLGGVSLGTTIITYTIGTGPYACSVTETITVCPVPVASININLAGAGTGTMLCAGSCIDLYGYGGTSSGTPAWTSSNTAVATVTPVIWGLYSTEEQICGVSAGTAIITYSITNGCGCVGYAYYTVTVNPSPSPITVPLSSLCVGSTETLTDLVAGGTWVSSNPGVGTIDPFSGLMGGINPGSTVVTYTLGSGASACWVTTTITVCPVPLVTIKENLAGIEYINLCIGSCTDIYGYGGTSSGTPSWTSSNTSVATVTMAGSTPGSSIGLVCGVGVGSAIITYSIVNSCGCKGSAYITVIVNPTPSPIIGSPTVCVGNTDPLSDLVAGGTWTSSNPGVGTIDPLGGVVGGITPGTTVITYTLGSGPSACSVTFTITVCPVPVANILVNVAGVSSGISICEGTCFDLYGNGGTSSGTPLWTSSNTAVATVTPVLWGLYSTEEQICGVSAGTAIITYSITNGCGCTGYAFFTVTVCPTPGPIVGTTTICSGSTWTFTDPTPGGIWSSSNTAIGTVDPVAGVVGGITAGTVTITYSIITGTTICSTSYTTSICPTPAPIIKSNLGSGGPLYYCGEGNISLSAFFGGPGASWTSSNPAVATVVGWTLGTSTTPSVANIHCAPTGTAIITYTIPGPCGCIGTAYFTINVNPAPLPITGVATICQGSTYLFTDPTPGGVWSSSDPTIGSVDALGNVTGVAGGTVVISYTTGIVPNECTSTFTVTVIGEPNACIGTSGPNFLVTGTVGAIVTLAVYNCAGVATGATYTVTIVSGGTLIPFSVAAGLGGCGFCVVQVAMGSCTWPVIGGCCADFNTPRKADPMGIEPPIQNETALSLLPNPNKGTFTLSGQFVGVSGKTEVKIEVVDMLGKTIYKENITLENGSINKDITLGDNIPNGVYLVRIKNENVNQVIRFTIDR